MGRVNFGTATMSGQRRLSPAMKATVRDNATEIFIMAMVFKNFFFYGLTNFINNWVANSGTEQAFNVMGGISAALVLPPSPSNARYKANQI